MKRTLIRNARLVDEGAVGKGALLIEGDRIEAIFPPEATPEADSLPEGTAVVEAEGLLLLPGIIDTHVHFRDGGHADNPAGDFLGESRAARAGGVTSVVDMPNTRPQTTSLEALEAKEEAAAARCMVNYGFMLGATRENIDRLVEVDPARYAAIKLFLGSSTGNMLVDDEERLDTLFRKARKLIVAHCEDEATVRHNLEEARSRYAGTAAERAALHPLIRTAGACLESSRKAVERARRYGTRFHIAHLTTAAELGLLEPGPVAGKQITAEVSPNHLWFDDSAYPLLGNKIKCNPAIKGPADRQALWLGLQEGLIDTVATDHAPHTLEAKSKPYFDAPSGIPSIQHSLQMMIELALHSTSGIHAGDADYWLPLIVEKMCHAPATLFGIKERGYLRPGYKADLVLVDLGGATTVEAADLKSKCGWSPLEGITLHSRIVDTYVNGCNHECPGEALAFSR